MESDEARQIEEWRRQMAMEEEEEYAQQQTAVPPPVASNGNSAAYLRGAGGGVEAAALPQRPYSPAAARVMERAPRAAGPAAAAAAPAGRVVDWNESALAQLELVQGQNAQLQLQLKEKQREFDRFKRDAELHKLTGGVRPPSAGSRAVGDGAKDGKIVELAKKNRSASMALERERTRADRLAGELKRANQALQAMQGGAQGLAMAMAGPSRAKAKKEKKVEPWSLSAQNSSSSTAAEGTDVSGGQGGGGGPEHEAKELKERLRDASARLGDQKVTNQTLKQELEKLKRALVKEVGEGVPLKTVSGRAVCRHRCGVTTVVTRIAPCVWGAGGGGGWRVARTCTADLAAEGQAARVEASARHRRP
jgi:hypothetical protein